MYSVSETPPGPTDPGAGNVPSPILDLRNSGTVIPLAMEVLALCVRSMFWFVPKPT
jgi:hypothetical protein